MPFAKYKTKDGWLKIGGGNFHISNGHTWIPPRARIWNGHEWVNFLEERHCDIWTANLTASFWSELHGNLVKTHYNPLWSWQHLSQGCYRPYHDSFDWGNSGGMMFFDLNDIHNKLSGARIERVELYLHSVHWGFIGGGTAVLGVHNARGWQERFSEQNHGIARVRYYHRDQGQWITLPNWVGDGFRDNWISGLTTKADNNSLSQYGIFAGYNEGWKAPKLRITYVK